MEDLFEIAKTISAKEWLEGFGLASLFAGVVIALLLIA